MTQKDYIKELEQRLSKATAQAQAYKEAYQAANAKLLQIQRTMVKYGVPANEILCDTYSTPIPAAGKVLKILR